MAFPARKFHPDRDRGAGDPATGVERARRAIDLVTSHNPDELLLLEQLPPMRERARRKRMVHMDIDAENSEWWPLPSFHEKGV